MILSLTPVLYTSDIKATMSFYTDVLGFTCNSFSEEPGWAHLSIGKTEIMLSSPNAHMPYDGPFFSGSFYFMVDDAQKMWKKLRETCSICYEPEDFDYGMREFAVFDNNGYVLQFGQDLNAGEDTDE